MGELILTIILAAYTVFIPIVFTDAEYVNEWKHKIFVDVGAAEEDAVASKAWDYLDPSPTVMVLNPEFEYHTPDGWLVNYVNFYLIEDGSYRWWTGAGEEEKCFGDGLCVTQWVDGFIIRSDFDIDVIIVSVVEDDSGS